MLTSPLSNLHYPADTQYCGYNIEYPLDNGYVLFKICYQANMYTIMKIPNPDGNTMSMKFLLCQEMYIVYTYEFVCNLMMLSIFLID